jgi:hypothetical protein
MNGFGMLRLVNGNKYRGNFVDGLEHGEGLAEDKDGYRYEGSFSAGKRHGTFVVKDSTGNVVRTCEYTMGQLKPVVPETKEQPKKTTTKKRRR